MRLCVIGNSHVAMLMAAHAADPAGITPAWFAKPGLRPDEMVLNGTVLSAASEELRARLDGFGTAPALDLAAFDAVAIVALAPSVFAAMRLLQDHDVTGWPSGTRRVAKALRSERPLKRPLLTRAALRAALTGQMQASPAAGLAAALRATAPDLPVSFIAQPFPAESMLSAESRYPVFRRIAEAGDGAALAEDLSAAEDAVFGPLGTAILRQPTETVARGCHSRDVVMRGAKRLAGGRQQNEDPLHANAVLGADLLCRLYRSHESHKITIKTDI